MSLSGISGLSGLSAIIPSAGGGGADEAAEFIAAAGIVDETEISAVETLVADLKDAGLWDLLEVIYPFVGEDATAHSLNLRNIATFPITWNGSVTHNSSGVQGDAATGWGDTGIIPNAMNISSWSHGVYNRQETTFGNQADFNCADNLSEEESTFVRCYPYSGGTTILDNPGQTNNTLLRASTGTALGFFSVSRESDNLAASYYNGVQTASTGANDLIWPSVSIAVLAQKFGGVFGDGVTDFSFHQLAFAFKGLGMNSSQMAAFYSIIQNFNGTLARQV